MRREPHPLTGTIYEHLGDGRVRVRKVGANAYGIFTWQGEWLEGEVTQADPQMGSGAMAMPIVDEARQGADA